MHKHNQSGITRNAKEEVMHGNRTYAARGGATVAVLVLGVMLVTEVGCGTGNGGQVKELVAGGSTFVDPMMREWAGSYDKAKGVRIDYKGGGSGKGISQ